MEICVPCASCTGTAVCIRFWSVSRVVGVVIRFSTYSIEIYLEKWDADPDTEAESGAADLGGAVTFSRSIRSSLTRLADSRLAMAGSVRGEWFSQPNRLRLSINQTATNRASLVEKSAFRLASTKRK